MKPNFQTALEEVNKILEQEKAKFKETGVKSEWLIRFERIGLRG